MNDKKMSNTDKFNKWHSERLGGPLGVMLGKKAVDELTEENKQLRDALERSNFAFKVNLARTNVKCEQSMIEALERNNQLLKK